MLVWFEQYDNSDLAGTFVLYYENPRVVLHSVASAPTRSDVAAYTAKTLPDNDALHALARTLEVK